MDHGHGLVDRMLIATPLAYRPTLSKMETAADQLSTEVVDNFEEYFANINDTVEHLHFTFPEDAKLPLPETIDDFVAEVNTAIQQGQVPPKSKGRSSFLELPQLSMSLITLWKNCLRVLPPHRHQL